MTALRWADLTPEQKAEAERVLREQRKLPAAMADPDGIVLWDMGNAYMVEHIPAHERASGPPMRCPPYDDPYDLEAGGPAPVRGADADGRTGPPASPTEDHVP